ncbi:hypothetical protein [Exiguobacterium flavidum]|uniref:hypothetical protein n=1 Tax=Exiguobacterium flavidum TaxID=2184695 RepID=UPI000DF73538|nr:hypothetical protein [Exiguobacterium flavidum]
MKAGFKFSGRFAKSGASSANLVGPAIDFTIEAINFGFALYEYNQLKKVSRELEHLLDEAKAAGKAQEEARIAELLRMKTAFEQKVDAERMIRQRSLDALKRQLEEQRIEIVRIERLKLEERTFNIRQEFIERTESLTLIERSIHCLAEEQEWFEELLAGQFGGAAKQTMEQVLQLEELIRQLQARYTALTKSMV